MAEGISTHLAGRAGYTTTQVDTDFEYDNSGRVTAIDAGSSVVKFDYTYVTNENNIYRKTFDHRTSDPYNEYSYDDLDRLTGVIPFRVINFREENRIL